jgi:hypothetical protein
VYLYRDLARLPAANLYLDRDESEIAITASWMAGVCQDFCQRELPDILSEKVEKLSQTEPKILKPTVKNQMIEILQSTIKDFISRFRCENISSVSLSDDLSNSALSQNITATTEQQPAQPPAIRLQNTSIPVDQYPISHSGKLRIHPIKDNPEVPVRQDSTKLFPHQRSNFEEVVANPMSAEVEFNWETQITSDRSNEREGTIPDIPLFSISARNLTAEDFFDDDETSLVGIDAPIALISSTADYPSVHPQPKGDGSLRSLPDDMERIISWDSVTEVLASDLEFLEGNPEVYDS